jgi:phage-related protein
MVETFNFEYRRAYQTSIKYNTQIDEIYSGGEQRKNLWASPKSKWVLEFEKDNTDTDLIKAFFKARKGRYEAFYWTFYATNPFTDEVQGGDDVTYTVRFDTDQLEIKHKADGFTSFTIPIIQVAS